MTSLSNQSIPALIVDDEQHARENLRSLLGQHCPQVEITGEASHIEEALKFINLQSPELVFLDIKLADRTGFELLELVEKKDFGVIFVTAYDQYAIRAIRFSAVDYILKPINYKELKEAVLKFQKRSRLEKKVVQMEVLIENLSRDKAYRRLGLNLEGRTEVLVVQDIVRLQGESNYTRLFFRKGESILVAKSLFEFEELLRDLGFLRIHKTHLVNRSYVRSIVKKGDWKLEIEDGSILPVSRKRKKEVGDILQGR